jgi:formate dehydrogenase maturation protein FdhE
MGFISLAERLKLLTSLSHNEAYAHIQQYLTLHERIYRAHESFLTEYPAAITDWLEQLSMTCLEAKARDTKDSLIRFLEARSFEPNTLLVMQEIILARAITDPTQKMRYATHQSHIQNSHADLTQLVTAVLQGDNSVIQSYADRFDLDSSFFLFLLSSILQPFIEAIAQNASLEFFEKWWQSLCPVCGRTPVVARIRKRRRYLMCAFCGAEYLSDHFLCVHCDKVINDDKNKEPIPRFLEDILTLDLDLYAQRAGLTRDV